MTDKNEKVSRLAETEIFRQVPEDQLKEIAVVLKDKRVSADTILFREGDPGDCFYIVHSGRIRVFLSGENGVETTLNWLGPGDSFGEMALLTDEPRSSTIEAVEDTHLFVLTKEEFEGVLRKNPDIYKNCIKFISDLVKKDDKRILAETEREYRTTRLSVSDFVFIGIVVLFFATIFNLSNPNRISVLPRFFDQDEIPKVNVENAKKKFDEGETIFVDARPSNFYDKSHIKGAINLPLPSFAINYMYMASEDPEKAIVVYGRSIGAQYDEEVARQLELFGHDNVEILKGKNQFLPLRWFALDTWKGRGYPVEGTGHE